MLVDSIRIFKERMDGKGYVLGPFMKTCDPAFVESAGYSGFDFAILDMEHGPASIESMQNLIRGAQVSGILPIIRVPDISETSIGKALDIGASGVQVPQIQNAHQAEQAIKAAKFYPEGERGVCRFVRAARYSAMDRYEYFKTANEALVILQLEGLQALENIDEILKVPGIDILFIGPYDLSQSLGIPGQISNPVLIEKMEYIVGKAKSRNIHIGTFIDRMEHTKRWKNAGVKYLSYSVDVGIFHEACREIVQAAQA